MPNALAHFGVHGVATRALIKDADPKWILAGSLIPDVPWILRRAVNTLSPETDLFDMRLYAMVQSTLLGSLVLAAGLALLSARARRVFAILALNSLFHLLLDACQTKWGNGVQLFAPWSWELWNLQWFWPESLPNAALTSFGLLYAVWLLWKRPGPRPAFRLPGARRLAAAAAVLAIYYAGPFALMDAAEASDAHSIHTLRTLHAGPVAIDRDAFRDDRLETWSNQSFKLEGDRPPRPGQISLEGTLRPPETIVVDRHHLHEDFPRDTASYVGLALLLLFWVPRPGRRG